MYKAIRESSQAPGRQAGIQGRPARHRPEVIREKGSRAGGQLRLNVADGGRKLQCRVDPEGSNEEEEIVYAR